MKTNLSAGEKSKLYFPQLDSIRGISFITIFLFHTLRINYDNFFLGDFVKYLYSLLPFGLEVFFILSSFLLTYLALNEYEKRGSFSLKNYFKRRVLRIWPLYFFILILAFILFPSLAHLFHNGMTLADPLFYIFFIANFYTAGQVFFLQFLWTISVEEQFYLFWGLSLRFLHRNLNQIIFILFLISISFTVYAITNGVKYYFNSLTYLFDFGCGGIGAILMFKNAGIIKQFNNFSRAGTFAFYCYLPFHFIVFYILNENTKGIINDVARLAGRYLLIIYVTLFIIEQLKNCSRIKIFERSRFLIFTGKISYGLYCFHGISITAINLLIEHFQIGIPNWLAVLIYFIINYFIASVSYLYLEMPFLKLKAKWKRV